MTKSNANFFSSLATGMAGLLNHVVKEESYSLFRKAAKVVLGAPQISASPDYHLLLVNQTTTDNEKGSFTVAISPDRFFVYRNPARLRVSFALLAPSLTGEAELGLQDKLQAYFFDHRMIDPILPESFQTKVGLYDRLCNQRAELRALIDPSTTATEGFLFCFDYLALYHSGNPLREETRTKQRVIEYSNDLNERSIQ